MMATEATVENPVDAPVSKPASILDHDSHHVDAERAILNGSPASDDLHNKHITSVEEQLNSAEPSVSGGSDTEASKADPSKSQDGDRGHGRTSSTVKKPATFKAVSVNKTFLAAKVATTGTTPKPGEKTASSPSLSAALPGGSIASATRPRLVAKSGSGLGSSVPRFSSAVNGGRPGVAPDGNAVWNKNRPVPPPDPKKFTDEELQKYGIHMATRLGADTASGQGNWADIDDDDDTWQPDSITWTDGTKVPLPQPDEAPAPLPIPEPLPDPVSALARVKPIEKPKSPAPVAMPSPSVKPGVLGSGKGLILKGGGSADKPTLVAKPPAPPTPVKSPWAPLPAVDKASPVITELPPNQGLQRPAPRELQDPKGMPPPLAKQMAPDDFSRSWRDGPTNPNRELYNSHSGRYEPVPERRGSLRQDGQGRQPALLQRPAAPEGPAEPSPAFQTTRTAQDPPFGRRRNSSNVSGGSGSYGPRLGRAPEQPMPPPDVISARRGSITGSIESPVSPRNFSPQPPAGSRLHTGQSWQPRQSPVLNHAKPYYSAPGRGSRQDSVGSEAQPVTDVLQIQKSVMSEGSRLARERKLAEEAREEEARRERIRKKLEELGPAPERKSEKDPVIAKDEGSPGVQVKQRDSPTKADPAAPNHVPGATILKTSSLSEAVTQASSPFALSKQADAQGSPPTTAEDGHSNKGLNNRQGNLWDAKGTQSDRFSAATWGSASQQGSRSVWANDRGLGNGTFNTELGSTIDNHAAPISQPPKSGPAPIAPPSSSRHAQNAPQQPKPEWTKTWNQFVPDSDKEQRAKSLAEREERDRQLAERGISIDKAQSAIKDTWRPVQVPGDGTRGPSQAPVTLARQEAPAQPISSGRESSVKGPAQTDASRQEYAAAGFGAGSGGSTILATNGSNVSAQPRPSRFFPARDIRLEAQAPVEPERPESPTPPPPTMAGHPVYDGDALRPHVSLPRPQPVVKLPPAPAPAQSVNSRSGPSLSWTNLTPLKDGAHAAAPAAAPPTRHPRSQGMTESWQHKFDNLLGVKSSTHSKSMVVESASRNAFDHTHHNAATVSLPAGAIRLSGTDGQYSAMSKPAAEECFEEQEMGSLPPVRLPNSAPVAAWNPASPPPSTKPLPRSFTIDFLVSAEAIRFPQDTLDDRTAFRVKLTGMTHAIFVPAPPSRTRSNPRSSSGPSRRGGRHASAGTAHRGGGKSREASNSYPADHASTAPSSAPSSRSSRGNYRGRGETWSRRSPASSLPA